MRGGPALHLMLAVLVEYQYSICRVDLNEDKYIVSKDLPFGDKHVWTCLFTLLLCLASE